MNLIAREKCNWNTGYGDVEWEINRNGTSKEIEIDYEEGGANPLLKIKLDPRPKDKDKKVEKKIVRFHFTLKNVWR